MKDITSFWNTEIPFRDRLLKMLKDYNAPTQFIVELEDAITNDIPLSGEYLDKVAEWIFNYEEN